MRLVLAAVTVGLIAAVAPALAAEDHTVTASNYVFAPRDITIAPGDRVVFANGGGIHNFAFDDGQAFPASPTDSSEPVWDTPLSRTFTTAGTYRFACDLHGPEMSGTITVTGTAPSPAPTATPEPSPTPPPGTGTTPSGDAPVRVRSLASAAASFCVRRGPECRRPGVRLRIDLSAPARVTGVLRRRPPRAGAPARRFGRVDFGTVAAGPRTLRFRRTASGKRLTAGRYTLAVTVRGAGTTSLSFRIR
jgi:plastocyanin